LKKGEFWRGKLSVLKSSSPTRLTQPEVEIRARCQAHWVLAKERDQEKVSRPQGGTVEILKQGDLRRDCTVQRVTAFEAR